MAMFGISLPIWRDKLHAGVAEAQAMRAMSEADLRAMTRMIEGDAAVAVSQLQASRDRQAALTTDVLPRARWRSNRRSRVTRLASFRWSVSSKRCRRSGWCRRSHCGGYRTRSRMGASRTRHWIMRGDRPMTSSSTLRRIGAPVASAAATAILFTRRACGAACAIGVAVRSTQ